MAFQQG